MRNRQSIGKLIGLSESIDQIGLLQPIVVTEKYELIGGERRIRSYRAKKWSEIPCYIINIDDIVVGEFAENEYRKQLSVLERVKIGEMVGKRIKEYRTRSKKRGARKEEPDPDSPFAKIKGNIKELSARAVDMSTKSFDRAAAVVAAAAESTQSYGDLIEMMEDRGIAPAFNELNRRRASEFTEKIPETYQDIFSSRIEFDRAFVCLTRIQELPFILRNAVMEIRDQCVPTISKKIEQFDREPVRMALAELLECLDAEKLDSLCLQLNEEFRDFKPHAMCGCRTDGRPDSGCERCYGYGWRPKAY